MAVDAQRIVADYLREHDDVVALATRVRSTPTKETNASWVQVVQLSETRNADDPTHHLTECYFQVDCYAGVDGGLPEAATLARTVRDALVHISEVDHDGGVVTASEIANGFSLIRDSDLGDKDGNPRDRVVVTANVWLHE